MFRLFSYTKRKLTTRCSPIHDKMLMSAVDQPLPLSVAQLTSEKAVAEAYAGELKTALEEAYEYIEQLEEER